MKSRKYYVNKVIGLKNPYWVLSLSKNDKPTSIHLRPHYTSKDTAQKECDKVNKTFQELHIDNLQIKNHLSIFAHKAVCHKAIQFGLQGRLVTVNQPII